MVLTSDPTSVDSEDLQKEFLEFTKNSTVKIAHNSLSLHNFLVNQYTQRSAKIALLILIPFSSTYLCEADFLLWLQ